MHDPSLLHKFFTHLSLHQFATSVVDKTHGVAMYTELDTAQVRIDLLIRRCITL